MLIIVINSCIKWIKICVGRFVFSLFSSFSVFIQKKMRVYATQFDSNCMHFSTKGVRAKWKWKQNKNQKFLLCASKHCNYCLKWFKIIKHVCFLCTNTRILRNCECFLMRWISESNEKVEWGNHFVWWVYFNSNIFQFHTNHKLLSVCFYYGTKLFFLMD